MKKQQTATVADLFASALATCGPQAGETVGIALSGGLDSAALLHLAHAWAQEQGVALHAFHVHHGLSPNADAWLAHCAQACAGLGIAFEARKVTLEKNAKTGTEEAARKRRYAALGELCAAHGVRLPPTAHHQADQAELERPAQPRTRAAGRRFFTGTGRSSSSHGGGLYALY